MTGLRALILTAGPVVIVGTLYWLTMAGTGHGLAAPRAVERTLPILDDEPSIGIDPEALPAACRQAADELSAILGAECRVIVRPPYVLAGNLSEETLDRCHRLVIAPVERALMTTYFHRRPDRPVTVLLFADEASYRAQAARLDGRAPEPYYGYYHRGDRRIVLNVSTGDGTLAHELTHALAHFDFPDMPEWFDEGLASLHEQAEFSNDGLRIVAQSNWRLNHLLHALRSGRLRPLESLVTEGLRPGHEEVDYAHARYLCLWLQQRQLLVPYYHKLRTSSGGDPSGARTLRQLLHVQSLDEVEHEFRQWAEGLHAREDRRPGE